jgi:hypothetical protein
MGWLEIAALAEVLPVGTHVYVTATSVAGQPARECRNFRASRVSRDVKQGLASTTIVSTTSSLRTPSALIFANVEGVPSQCCAVMSHCPR